MDPRRVDRQPGRHLPGDVLAQRVGGLAIRKALEGLEDHRRRDHIRGHRWAPPTRREQVGEQLVREQLVAMIRQERVHRTIGQTAARSRAPQPDFFSSLLVVLRGDDDRVAAVEGCLPTVPTTDLFSAGEMLGVRLAVV